MKKADKSSSAGTKNDSSTNVEVEQVCQPIAKPHVGSSSIFKLDNVVIKEPKYTIGVDTYDENANAYCLVRMVDEKMEVILAKTIRDKKKFDKEVENLSKYFGAAIIKEVD